MSHRIKQLARRSKTMIVAFGIYKNWQMRRRFNNGHIESLHGSSHAGKTVEASLSYIEEQFQDYLAYAGLGPGDLQGKRVLELGFGDNLGVALKFLIAGAEKVVCIDKFCSHRDSEHEREVYDRMRQGLTEAEAKRFDEAISVARDVIPNPNRLSCINGQLLEDAIKNLAELQQPFDLVVSRAVIEEIYEPGELFAAMDTILRPGGYMLHKIDLSDYGMFRDVGMHPLTFLTIPQATYRLMATDSGIPNRKRMEYYRKTVSTLR